jgi:1-acyl-sn-glycerol-3-phosphate acyltransferase
VVVFPEGTRVRPGPLGEPRRGIGRLALETGAPVVPVAVIGSDAVRRGWRIRPRKVRLRVGAPLRYPTVERCSPALAAAVTERIWACVSLQWDWLGGSDAATPAQIGEAPRREVSRAA